MKQKAHDSKVAQKSALGGVENVRKKEKSTRKRYIVMFFFLLRGGITPESNDGDLKQVVDSLQSRREKFNEARGVIGLSDLVAGLLSQFENILNELRTENENDANAINAWLAGDRKDLFTNFDLLGIRTLGDLEALYIWARDEYFPGKENEKNKIEYSILEEKPTGFSFVFYLLFFIASAYYWC